MRMTLMHSKWDVSWYSQISCTMFSVLSIWPYQRSLSPHLCLHDCLHHSPFSWYLYAYTLQRSLPLHLHLHDSILHHPLLSCVVTVHTQCFTASRVQISHHHLMFWRKSLGGSCNCKCISC